MGISSMQQNRFNSLLNWFLSSKSNYVFDKEPWNEAIFAEAISANYAHIKSNINKNLITQKQLSFINTFNPVDYESGNLTPIRMLQQIFLPLYKENILSDVILHGSYGTLDYKLGWSDVDISVILNDDAFTTPGKLIILRKNIIDNLKYLYQLDPLQHHEFLLSTSLDQLFSATPAMPPEVLIYGRSLVYQTMLPHNSDQSTATNAKQTLKNISQLFEKSLKSGYMKHHQYEGIYLDASIENKNSMYQLKYFLSLIMTMPAYFYNSIDQPMYKRQTFDAIRSDYNFNLELLDKATKIRNLWPQNEKHPYVGNEVPMWVEQVLEPNFFNRAVNFANELLDAVNQHENK